MTDPTTAPRRSRRTPAAPPPAVDVIDPAPDWRNPVNGNGRDLIDPADLGDDLEETAADRVAAMLQGARGDARAVVKIYREPEKGKALTWCADMAPEDFEQGGFESIRRNWGSGDYVIRLYGTRPGKAGSLDGFGVIAAQHLTIAASLTEVAAPSAVPNGLSQVLDTLARGQQAMLDALTKRPEVDQLAQLGTMLGLMTQMREAMGMGGGAARAAAPKTLLEQLQEMRAIKELLPELGLTPGEAGEDKDPLMGLLGDVVGIVKATQGSAPGQPVMPVTLPASVAAAPANEHTPATTGEPMPVIEDPQELLKALRKQLQTLVKLAAANVDPDVGATMVYDNLPDDMIPVLESEQWFEALAQFEPGVTPHRPWFDKVRAMALDWFANGYPDDAEEGGDA